MLVTDDRVSVTLTMFHLTLTTILSLVAPAVIAPLACLGCLWLIKRVETDRRTARSAAPPHIVLDSAATPLAADPVGERHVA